MINIGKASDLLEAGDELIKGLAVFHMVLQMATQGQTTPKQTIVFNELDSRIVDVLDLMPAFALSLGTAEDTSENQE